MDDPYNLARFVAAQDGIYDVALSEIRSGRKQSHWMWFVFPQIAGLGSSPMSARYAISSVNEARAYLDHPLLGYRYRECVKALQSLPGRIAEEVFGRIDAQKLQSSLTLFSAMRDEALFETALDRWFDGRRDEATLRILEEQGRDVRGGKWH